MPRSTILPPFCWAELPDSVPPAEAEALGEALAEAPPPPDPVGMPVEPPPTPVAEATEEGMYPPTWLAKRIGASDASTALPSISTGTLTFRLWYSSSTGLAT